MKGTARVDRNKPATVVAYEFGEEGAVAKPPGLDVGTFVTAGNRGLTTSCSISPGNGASVGGN